MDNNRTVKPTLEFNPEKMYARISGYAAALDWRDVLSALAFMKKSHEGQTRKDGQPYVVHPLTMACHAIALGVRKPSVIAALLLHDVCEDCGVAPGQLPVSKRTREIVSLLTRVGKQPLDEYYAPIGKDPDAALCKILDCCHNVTSMAGPFSIAKIREQIEEKERYIYPLFSVVKHEEPDYGNMLFILKYQIVGIDNSLLAVMDAMAAQDCEQRQEGGV